MCAEVLAGGCGVPLVVVPLEEAITVATGVVLL